MTQDRSASLLSRALLSEQGIYGSIVIAGVVATAGSAETDALTTLVFVVSTIAVLWLAHVFAGTMASHVQDEGESVSARIGGAALWHSMRGATGILVAMLLPAAMLLLGVFGVITDYAAVWASLWAVVGLLGVLGYVAGTRKGFGLLACLASALVSAGLGFLIIVAKLLLAH